MDGSLYTSPGYLGNFRDLCGLLMVTMDQQFPSDALTPCDTEQICREFTTLLKIEKMCSKIVGQCLGSVFNTLDRHWGKCAWW